MLRSFKRATADEESAQEASSPPNHEMEKTPAEQNKGKKNGICAFFRKRWQAVKQTFSCSRNDVVPFHLPYVPQPGPSSQTASRVLKPVILQDPADLLPGSCNWEQTALDPGDLKPDLSGPESAAPEEPADHRPEQQTNGKKRKGMRAGFKKRWQAIKQTFSHSPNHEVVALHLPSDLDPSDPQPGPSAPKEPTDSLPGSSCQHSCEPQPAPSNPQPALPEPQLNPSEPQPDLSEPQPVPPNPHPNPSEPQPNPSNPQTAPPDPQPNLSDPQPVPPDPQPNLADPEPNPSNPQPNPPEPQPGPCAPNEPTDSLPGSSRQHSSEPQPAPSEPQPGPSVIRHTGNGFPAPLKYKQTCLRQSPNFMSFSSLYKVGTKLGAGYGGTVFEGTRKCDGEKVAIKFIDKEVSDYLIIIPGCFKPLYSEIALNLLLHKPEKCPNIVEMLDWFEDGNQYILIMEYPYPCMNLNDFLKLHGHCLSEMQARNLMHQAVIALKHCFDNDVYHDDIKADNILVNTDTLQLKLIDFGEGELASTSGTPGTENYGRTHAVAETVSSLGFLLCEMFSGNSMVTSEHWRQLAPLDLSKECIDVMKQCMSSEEANMPTLDKLLRHKWFKRR